MSSARMTTKFGLPLAALGTAEGPSLERPHPGPAASDTTRIVATNPKG